MKIDDRKSIDQIDINRWWLVNWYLLPSANRWPIGLFSGLFFGVLRVKNCKICQSGVRINWPIYMCIREIDILGLRNNAWELTGQACSQAINIPHLGRYYTSLDHLCTCTGRRKAQKRGRMESGTHVPRHMRTYAIFPSRLPETEVNKCIHEDKKNSTEFIYSLFIYFCASQNIW